MKLTRKFFKNNFASAAVEFAIISPLLILMLFGSFELSRYIMAVRKVENAVNDIAFLISREGTISDINGDGSISTSSEDSGRLNNLVNSLLPVLIYPFLSNAYEFELRNIARPVGATINPDELRLMWAHKVSKRDSNGGTVSTSGGEYSITSGTTSVSGTAAPSSIYSDGFGQRAELAFPGESFVLANLAISYSDPLGFLRANTSIDLAGGSIEKIASYAARKRWFDNGDLVIQANEFYNQLHVCVTCVPMNSATLSGEHGRSKCTKEHTPYSHTSGCNFN